MYSRNRISIAIFYTILLTITVSQADRLLKYKRVQQKQDQWCWAASSSWILAYHTIILGSTDTLSQVEVNKYGWADGKVRNMWNWIYTQAEGGDVIDGQTYKGRGINWILPHFGVPVHNIQNGCNYTLNEASYKAAIDAGNPFVIRWQWSTGGGHFVVAMAYLNKMCWIMNPWKNDGIQVYNYAWVCNGSVNGAQHTWDYTLETNRIDTLPDLVSTFPSKIIAGKSYSVALKANTKSGKDVSSIAYYVPISPMVTIDSTTNTLSWICEKEGKQTIEFEMNYGNARDTIQKSFDVSPSMVNFTPLIKQESDIICKKSQSKFTITLKLSDNSNSKAVIDLYSPKGEIVYSTNVSGTGVHTLSFNTNSYAQGVYVLKISNNFNCFYKRIMFS